MIPTFYGREGEKLYFAGSVANVYRKSKQIAVSAQETDEDHPQLKDPQRP